MVAIRLPRAPERPNRMWKTFVTFHAGIPGGLVPLCKYIWRYYVCISTPNAFASCEIGIRYRV
jgi:hypothetical protein